MSPSKQKLPFDIKEVYGSHPVRKESFLLDNESSSRIGSKEGACAVSLVLLAH